MDILLDISPGQALPLAARGHYLLQVQSGRIWLTRCGDPADHFLDPGQQLMLHADAGVVVESDGSQPARISLVRPDGWWSRLQAGLWWRLAVLALSRLRQAAPAWPPELLELDEHALRDIGVSSAVRTAVRTHREHVQLRGAQLRLSVSS